jgi:uncharacterized membrane protein YesL
MEDNKLKKLQLIGSIFLAITIVVFIMYQINVSFPDWLVRVNGALMLIALFITVFSTTRLSREKR